MQVTIDSRALTSDIGSGVGWYTKQLIESLIKYTDLAVWAWYNAFKKSALTEILPTFDLPEQPIKITHWPNQLLQTVWSSPVANLLPIDFVTFFLRSRKKCHTDIFHAPSPIYGLPPARKVKRVVTIHDLTFLTHPETHSDNDLKMKNTIQKTLDQADAVIVVSKNTKGDLIKLLSVPPEKIYVIYEAPREVFQAFKVRSSRLEESKKALKKWGIRKPYFLYVGSLEPRKNLVRLVKAFEQFQRSHYPTTYSGHQLVLAGGQAWKSAEIIKAVESSPARDKIILTGYVFDRDLVILYNHAQALFYVPLYEGFGLPVLEAMAGGCPVVTSNTSSLPEVGGSVAEYVNPESVDAITQKMIKVANWPQEARHKKQEVGLRWVKNFTWQKVAQETKKVYQNLTV